MEETNHRNSGGDRPQEQWRRQTTGTVEETNHRNSGGDKPQDSGGDKPQEQWRRQTTGTVEETDHKNNGGDRPQEQWRRQATGTMEETGHRNNKQCNRKRTTNGRNKQNDAEKSDTLFKTKLKSMLTSKGKMKLLFFFFFGLFVCFLSQTFFPRDSTKQYLFSANHAFFKQQTNMRNGNFT